MKIYKQRVFICSVFCTLCIIVLSPHMVFASDGHLDWTNFTYRVVNFIAVIAIMYVVGGKKIRAFFEQRKAQIVSDFENIAREKHDIVCALEDIKTKMKKVEEERTMILMRAEEEALALKELMLADVEEEVKKITQYAQRKMEIEQEKMKHALIAELAERIYEEVEQRLHTSLSPALHKEIVHSSIKKVVAFEKEINSKTLC